MRRVVKTGPKPGVVAHVCIANTGEVKARRISTLRPTPKLVSKTARRWWFMLVILHRRQSSGGLV
jgi:hypothetical protein